jgi:hypothetical protein
LSHSSEKQKAPKMKTIPLIDIRDSSPIALMETHAEGAKALIHASRNLYGVASRIASHGALPLSDALAKRWLIKTQNPYREEIFTAAEMAETPGVIGLNLAYEWGCTSAAYESVEGPKLTRVLDWPFKALGENMVVAHQRGIAGDFYNITWPAVSGIFNAVAPQRFAAALNQAPMRRYRTGIALDWIRNRALVYRSHALPPAHLLRKVFETATRYDEAKHMLMYEPISLPVIYTLSGIKAGEGCVIERLENTVALREMSPKGSVSAANHFESHLNGIGHGWMPRAMVSHDRSCFAESLLPNQIQDDFAWFAYPAANPLSRLAMLANAATGEFQVMGTEGATPVTVIFNSKESC